MDWCLYSIYVGRCLFSFLFHFHEDKTRRPVGLFALFSISFALEFGIVLTPVTRRLVYLSLPLSHIHIFLLSFRSTNESRQNKISEAERQQKEVEEGEEDTEPSWTNERAHRSWHQKSNEHMKYTVRIVGFFHTTHCTRYALHICDTIRMCVRIGPQNLDTHAFPHILCARKSCDVRIRIESTHNFCYVNESNRSEIIIIMKTMKTATTGAHEGKK